MIHPTAIISKEAKLGNNVKVGPFAIIDGDVVIGDNCEIGPKTHIEYTRMGSNNYIGEGTLIGGAPQDLKYKNEKSFVKIGDNNSIREYVTVHRATHEGASTDIGSNCFILTQVHIGHDCKVGNKITMINNAGLAGHVTIDDCAVLSGYSKFHQFTRVGSYAMVGGDTKIVKDVAPYITIDGNPSQVFGLNKVGLKRNGFTPEKIKILKDLYEIFFRDKTLVFAEAIKKIETTLPQSEEVKYFLEFARNSKRGIER